MLNIAQLNTDSIKWFITKLRACSFVSVSEQFGPFMPLSRALINLNRPLIKREPALLKIETLKIGETIHIHDRKPV